MTPIEHKLENTFHQFCRKNNLIGSQLSILHQQRTFQYYNGNLSAEEPYYIASTTKLYVTALILQAVYKQQLSLNDTIDKYLDETILKNLHVYKGKEYSSVITIEHLLSHTSGLPDYFEDSEKSPSLFLQLIKKGDRGWTFTDALQISKSLKPHFAPGYKNKAHYSDTNYQLLGAILEKRLQQNLDTILKTEILQKLKLNNTRLYTDPDSPQPQLFNYRGKPFNIPKAMASFKADGGIIANSIDCITFLKAFFNGTYFPAEQLPSLYKWKRVMFPLEYGTGIMRFKLPRIFSPFKEPPEFIGHSGLCGAFAFYVLKQDLYIAGTTNQLDKPALSFQLMLKLANMLQ